MFALKWKKKSIYEYDFNYKHYWVSVFNELADLQESLSNKTNIAVSTNNKNTITDEITISQWIENLINWKKN